MESRQDTMSHGGSFRWEVIVAGTVGRNSLSQATIAVQLMLNRDRYCNSVLRFLRYRRGYRGAESRSISGLLPLSLASVQTLESYFHPVGSYRLRSRAGWESPADGRAVSRCGAGAVEVRGDTMRDDCRSSRGDSIGRNQVDPVAAGFSVERVGWLKLAH